MIRKSIIMSVVTLAMGVSLTAFAEGSPLAPSSSNIKSSSEFRADQIRERGDFVEHQYDDRARFEESRGNPDKADRLRQRGDSAREHHMKRANHLEKCIDSLPPNASARDVKEKCARHDRPRHDGSDRRPPPPPQQ